MGRLTGTTTSYTFRGLVSEACGGNPVGGKSKMNISDLRQKAQRGSVVAQTILGTCYLDGIDVEVDHKEAFRLLSAAADQGAPRAKMNLARMSVCWDAHTA